MIKQQISQMSEDRRRAAAALPLFDASLWLGRPEGFPLSEPMDAQALKPAASEYGIGGGLVSDWRGKTVSPQAGNRALEESQVAPPGRFFTVMTGLPLTAREAGPLPGAGELSDSVKAVRLFPESHEFPLDEWCIGTLCRWVIEHGLPLMIWHTELHWRDLYELARELPDLAIVVESQPQKIIYHVRPLHGLMRECPNVLAETSNLANESFKWLIESFGPERFLFGSFLPVNDPLVPIGMLIDSGLSETDQKLIAGENLRRLIGEGAW